MIDAIFVVREDKTKEFLELMKKPMITKEFLAECKDVAKRIKNVDSRKRDL